MPKVGAWNAPRALRDQKACRTRGADQDKLQTEFESLALVATAALSGRSAAEAAAPTIKSRSKRAEGYVLARAEPSPKIVDANGRPNSLVRLSADQAIEPHPHSLAMRVADGDLHLADGKPAVDVLHLFDHGVRRQADTIEIGGRK